MALNWNISKCKDVEEIKSGQEWGTTHALIWATMTVGLGEISENNLNEFLFRLKVIEKTFGPLLIKGPGETLCFTPEMVRKRIGLSTNVSNETRSAWLKRQMKYFYETVEKEVREEIKEENAENQ